MVDRDRLGTRQNKRPERKGYTNVGSDRKEKRKTVGKNAR